MTALAPSTTSESGVSLSTLADQLVIDLANAGINTYFGVPGGAIEPLFNALARQERMGRIRLFPTRSEAGACFAADGYYRETGKIAVCAATTGPGTSNLVTALMSADADRIPLLALTPQVPMRKQGRGALQDSSRDGHDTIHMLAQCTRYSAAITHADQMKYKLSRALFLAKTPPAGPVHLSFPSDVLAGSSLSSNVRGLPEPCAPLVDHSALQSVISTVLGAEHAVFYVGDDAGAEAAKLCDIAAFLNAKVVSSPAGKRWLAHSHRSYLGVVGFSGHAAAQRALDESDVIVAFGATFDELSTNAWTVFPEVPLFSLDLHVGHAHRIEWAQPIIANAESFVRAFIPIMPCGADGATGAPTTRVEPPALVEDVGGPVRPNLLMHWLGRNLPDDVVVHVDAGNSFSWSTRYLVRSAPNTYRVSMGLSTMCWAIGASLGAALGTRRRTVCVCGDGSMLMSGLELTAAVQQNAPVTYIILNDSALGMVRHGQRLSGAEPIAFEIPDTRFDRLAQACGANGVRVESVADLDQIPSDWYCNDESGPCVIDVRVDKNAVPPIADRVTGLAVGVAHAR